MAYSLCVMRNASEEIVADASRIGAVDRAMVLLRLLLERQEISVTEAAAELGVAASTAHRLLTTMAAHGFVARAAHRRYRVGELLGGASPDMRIASIVSMLRQVLRELYDEIGETAHLMVLVGTDTQFVDGFEGEQALRVGLRIGARIPAYCTSGGKAILAEFDDGYVDALHAGGLRPWPGQLVRTLPELHRDLAGVRAARVAYNREESERGVRALGVAVGREPGHPVAALSVSLPAERFGASDRKRIVRALLRAKSQARALL